MMTRWIQMSVLTGIGLLLLGLPAKATMQNGDFEDATVNEDEDRLTPDGWQYQGGVEVRGNTLPPNDIPLEPISGSYQAVIFNGRADLPPVNIAVLEVALQLDAGQLQNLASTVQKASAMWQTFSTGNLPETLSGHWNFLTQESASNLNNAEDFAFVSLSGGGRQQVLSTANIDLPLSALEDGTFTSSTGYQSYSLFSELEANTTYTLGFGVAEANWENGAINPSTLVVDNVKATPVPWEAEHSGLSIVGVGVWVGYRRYRRWQQRG